MWLNLYILIFIILSFFSPTFNHTQTLNKCLNAFDRRHAAEVDLLFCQANLDLDGQRKIKYYDKTDVYGLIGYKW
ncbi:MAG: hypothetical protein DME24_25235 [Verrucomicrobia bacterium]|nr:MAG: hypothetical protein DME24_25235 [Verrucomicrobiota bacterium]